MNPIICPMVSSDSGNIDEKTLANSNLKGFNNNVGSATNKASAIRDMMYWFKPDSDEYKELFKREQSIQRIQQSIIDSIKNGFSEQVPTCWYNNDKNVIIDNEYIENYKEKFPNKKPPKLDDEDTIKTKIFNQKITADKKPYYFAYIYPEVMRDVQKYEDNWKHNCIRLCGLTLKELSDKNHKTEYEKLILETYNKNYPVNNSPSVMNKICHIFEYEFDKYFQKKQNKTDFDYTILKTDKEYSKNIYKSISKLETMYKEDVVNFFISKRKGENSEDSDLARKKFINKYKRIAEEICEDRYQLCDIVLDMTYGKNKNHQFAWDLCGDTIIDNLLKLNNNMIMYFEKDKYGTIKYGGETFTKRKIEYKNLED